MRFRPFSWPQESSFALFARPVLQQVAEQMEKLKNSELKDRASCKRLCKPPGSS